MPKKPVHPFFVGLIVLVCAIAIGYSWQYWHLRQPSTVSKTTGDPQQYDPRKLDGSFKYTNGLISENSPYLLQHAHNPVEWRPWGTAAFEESRRTDKPIFLSIGYSTCHWCHVMERESFSREDVAEQINKNFVPVLVDREEHPEIDEAYQQAMQVEGGSNGWPATLALLPNGEPFFAASYLPKDSLLAALTKLHQSYLADRHHVQSVADTVMAGLREAEASEGVGGEPLSPHQSKLDLVAAINALKKNFDTVNGGFGGVPKFPPFTALSLIFDSYATNHDPHVLNMAAFTLHKMALGGIHDQLAGGFYRYATDLQWRVPHFEKMLTDNAQFGEDYARAYSITHDPFYKSVADDTYAWTLSHLGNPKIGSFYTALDADSNGVEGGVYLWTFPQMTNALGAHDAQMASTIYNVREKGNFVDPATGVPSSSNIMYLASPLKETPRTMSIRAKLLKARNARPQPRVDNQQIAGDNGLMISSLAKAGSLLGEPKYTNAALLAGRFAVQHLLQPNGSMWHEFAKGKAWGRGNLEDYAFLANGFLDLAQATGDTKWTVRAGQIADRLIKRFSNPAGAGFYEDASEPNLPLRIMDPFDNQLPSGNGIAALVLARLAKRDNSGVYAQEARATIDGFAQDIDASPSSSNSLIEAANVLAGVQAELQGKAAAKSPVTVIAVPTQIAMHEGDSQIVMMKVTIASGWHINSDQPLENDLVPTAVGMPNTNDTQVTAAVNYPKAKIIKPILSDTKLSVFTGTVNIPVQLTVADTAAMGSHIVRLLVQYQPCNGSLCLAPVAVPTPVTVTVVPS